MKVTIVGGGTAGYVSALILKTRYPAYEIEVVKSDKIGIIGVGEGTTEHWDAFMTMVGIDFKQLIRETDATLKAGVMFEGWTSKPYFHSIDELADEKYKYGQHLINYYYGIIKKDGSFYLNSEEFVNSRVRKNIDFCPTYQYHFNTFKLNKFLEKTSKEKGIVIHTDEIQHVETSETGIEHILGTKKYKSDFYIDCTGFKRILISKLGAKWSSYSKYLKLNQAIAFPTGDTQEYNMWTLAKAMKYGWMWSIPTYGRWGNGYIFNNQHISEEKALEEIETTLGQKIEVGKNIKFDPGALDKVWIKNCLAGGLSANFVEPLEATSIGTTISQMFLFIQVFQNYNQASITQYNLQVEKIMENIRDFIILHYNTDRNDTSFWKEKQEIPDSLKEKLEIWKTRLPIHEDFTNSNYLLFKEPNYAQVLNGLNLLDKDKLREWYYEIPQKIRTHIDSFMYNYYKAKFDTIGHKEYLNIIRE